MKEILLAARRILIANPSAACGFKVGECLFSGSFTSPFSACIVCPQFKRLCCWFFFFFPSPLIASPLEAGFLRSSILRDDSKIMKSHRDILNEIY
jgi:hypothetical protein